MTKVSMDLVKELRDKTQIGMMDCKKALEEAGGDIEKAIELLRKKGAAVAAKRADNATDNGRIESYLMPDFKQGALVEIACETDFSANTGTMKDLVLHAAQMAAETQVSDEAVLLEKNKKLKDHLDEVLAKISEKIHISRIAAFKVAEHGLVNAYIHPGSTIGVIIELATQVDPARDIEALKTIARDICMHIAVTKPLFVSPENADPATLEKERGIAMEQLKDTKKPANILEKIVEGKINKYLEEVCLVRQRFIKNEDLTIEQYLKETSTKFNNPMSIKRFVRFAINR